MRQPPKTLKQFVNSGYVDVEFSETTSVRKVLLETDIATQIAPTVTVPNFTTLTAFIKGTELITTSLDLMGQGTLKDLDSAPLPMKTKPSNAYMVWHRRDHDDPAHQWLRQRITETVNTVLKA